MPKLVKKAIVLAGLAASATGNNKVQPDFGSKAGIITNSPAVDKNYPSLKESLRDLEESPLRDFNHDDITTGQNPGTFKQNNWDEALKDWDDTKYGGRKRTKRYKRRLTHRKKKTIKRRKTRRTKRRR